MTESSHRKRRTLSLLLSHHPPGRLNRCLRVQLRGKVIYFCARCTGIFSGLVSAFLFLNIVYQFTLLDEKWVLIGALLILPTYVDWVTQSIGVRESTNGTRVLTGFAAGCGMSLLLLLMEGFLRPVFIAVNLYIGATLFVYLFWGRRAPEIRDNRKKELESSRR